MENPYTLAMRELAEKRERNHAEESRRHLEVSEKAPELAEIEKNLAAQGRRLIRCVLDKNPDFEDAKEKIQTLQAEKSELLYRLNLPADYLEEVAECVNCRDTGFDSEGRRCACLGRLITKYIGENANLTELMKKQTFEQFDFSLFASQEDVDGRSPLKIMQKNCDAALNFANSFEKTSENLLITGGAGTGKTFLCSCIANRVLERGMSVCYQTAYKLFSALEKIRFGREVDESAERLSEYVYSVDLLIIDDLGTEFISQFTAAALFDLLNSRLMAGKSTAISTNLSFADIDRTYAQRTVSRLLGEYRTINTIGKDLRLSKYRK